MSFHKLIRRFKTRKDTLVIIPDGTTRPFYLSGEYNRLRKKFIKNYEEIQFCQFNPFLGIIPLEISDMYPASHYVMPRIQYNDNEFPEFTKTWKMFFANNNFKTIYLAKDEFIKNHAKILPKKIKKNTH
jgi:7-cyano-7-deazaguanine tRNA-ribosyltransferase